MHLANLRPLQKGIFLPPALFANAHLLLNKLRFAAELKNKNLRFFARGLKLCKTLNLCLIEMRAVVLEFKLRWNGGEASKARLLPSTTRRAHRALT